MFIDDVADLGAFCELLAAKTAATAAAHPTSTR
jgi:hypothetical protein